MTSFLVTGCSVKVRLTVALKGSNAGQEFLGLKKNSSSRFGKGYASPMRAAAYKLMQRQKKRLKPRRVSKKGKRPKPAPPGTSPHTISEPGKSPYRLRMIGYEEIKPGVFAVGVRALTPKDASINVPLTHEKGGVIIPSNMVMRWHKLTSHDAESQRKRDEFRRHLKHWRTDHDWYSRNKKNFWIDKRSPSRYPPRPYLVPALTDLQQDIPHLFEGFFKGF